MSSFLLYIATGLVLLWLSSRYVGAVSRSAAVVLLLLPLMFTGRALLRGLVYAPIDLPYQAEPMKSMAPALGIERLHNMLLSDDYDQEIPWRQATRHALSLREWPLLNPFMFSGDLLAAAGQPAVYYPINVISWLLPLPFALTFCAAITFFLAGLSLFLFLRDLECRDAPALLGAAAWMYCSFLVFFLECPLAPAAAVLPLVFLGARRIARLPGVRSGMLLVVALAMLILAGHPETILHDVFVAAAYGLFELSRNRTNLLRAVLTALAAGAVSLLLCAIYLLPLLEALPQTVEHRYRVEVYARNGSEATPELARARLLLDFVPWAYGDPWHQKTRMPRETTPEKAYAGSLILGPAIFCVWRARRKEKWFFLPLALFGILAGSEIPPFPAIWTHVPLFNIALNDRLSVVGAFAVAVLAALGLQAWSESREDIRMATGFLAALGLTGLLVMIAWTPYKAIELAGDVAATHPMISLLPIVLGGLIFLLRLPPRVAIPLLLGILLVQRYAEEGETYPILSPKLFYPPIRSLASIRTDRGPFRIVGTSYTFIPNTATMYGLEDARGYSATTLIALSDTFPLWSVPQPVWFNRVDDLSRPFLSFLNVRYAIANRWDHPPTGWRRIDGQPGMQLFENTRALERFFIPRYVWLGTAPGAVIERMKSEDDFSQRSWIDEAGGEREEENGTGQLAISRRGLGFRIEASMQSAGWIVTSEAAWKGWRAYVDGKRTHLHLANHAFLALQVPAGKHEILFYYLPESFVIGRMVSLVMMVLLAGFGIARTMILRKQTLAPNLAGRDRV